MYKQTGSEFRVRFPTSKWDMLDVAAMKESSEGEEAVNLLTSLYWKPVLSYIKCCGYTEEAVELTEGFFVHCFLRDVWGKANRQKGRFRSLLITSLKNYLTTEYKRRQIEYTRFVSYEKLQEGSKEGLVADSNAEKEFDYTWKREMIIRVWGKLQEDFKASGQNMHIELFRIQLYDPFINGKEKVVLSELAEKFTLPMKTVSNMIITVKRAFKRLLRKDIAMWVDCEEEITEELENIIQSLESKS